MKLETPKDVFLHLSKYLHTYKNKTVFGEIVYFICPIITQMYLKDRIRIELYEKTLTLFDSYLLTHGKNYKSYKILFSEFKANEIKERKAFLKFIYEIELKHEQNNSN
jgi:hypothetical protein